MHPLVIVEQFVFSERANETVLNNHVELTIWDRLSQIKQLRELRQAQFSAQPLCVQCSLNLVFFYWNGRNNMVEAEPSSGCRKGKGKAKGKSKETAAALFQFYGTVTLNTAPISESSFFETYYLERLVVLTICKNWNSVALLHTHDSAYLHCTHWPGSFMRTLLYFWRTVSLMLSIRLFN